MKKAMVFGFCAALAAVLIAASSTKATAPAGTDNVAFGYGAGYQASGGNENVICIGTDAGARSGNNTDCIFIGAYAGTNVTGKTGFIDIGGTFMRDGDDVRVNGSTFSVGNGMAEFVRNGYYINFNANNVFWNELEAMFLGNGSIVIGPSGNVWDEGPQEVASLINGNGCCTYAAYSHAEGKDTATFSACSHTEGNRTETRAQYAHAEGSYSKACGLASHAEGNFCITSNSYSHAEGSYSKALGEGSHADGFYASAKGDYSHAIGVGVSAKGYSSIAIGYESDAIGDYSIALGCQTIAAHESSFVWSWNEKEEHENEFNYSSHGRGTFNLNPKDGLDGFYIGENTLRQHMRDEIAKPNAALKFADEDTAVEYTIKFKAGQLCVFTNGVKIGTLTFTPVQ